MLTKSDLKEFRKIVREEVESESQNLKLELQGDIKISQMRILNEIGELKNRLKNLEIKVDKIQKDLKIVVSFFDKEELRLQKRITRMEEHLRLPPLQ